MKKKDKIKELELQVNCLKALLSEYVIKEAISRIPVPDYKKGLKEGLAVVNQPKDEENKESFFFMDKDGNKHPVNPPYEFTNESETGALSAEQYTNILKMIIRGGEVSILEQQKQPKEQ